MFCPQCGTPHTPGGTFCGSCGTRLAGTALAAASPAPSPSASPAPAGADRPLFAGVMTPEQASRTSAPLFTLAIVVCVIGVGLAFASLTAVVRGLAGDDGARGARHVDARPAHGAFSTLLGSGGARSEPRTEARRAP